MYNNKAGSGNGPAENGIIAQLGEHLPYKQRVIGSSPIGPILQKQSKLNMAG